MKKAKVIVYRFKRFVRISKWYNVPTTKKHGLLNVIHAVITTSTK